MNVKFKSQKDQKTYENLLDIVKDKKAALDLTYDISAKRAYIYKTQVFHYRDMVLDGLDVILDEAALTPELTWSQLQKLEYICDLAVTVILEERYDSEDEMDNYIRSCYA